MIVADDTQRIGRDSDVTFVSLPSGKAMHLVPALLIPPRVHTDGGGKAHLGPVIDDFLDFLGGNRAASGLELGKGLELLKCSSRRGYLQSSGRSSADINDIASHQTYLSKLLFRTASGQL